MVVALPLSAGVREWTPLPIPGGEIVDLAFHPDDGDTLYAVSRTGGLFKTIDGGGRWTLLSSDLPRSLLAVRLDPASPNRLWVASPQEGVWRSEDGGGTWVQGGTTGSEEVLSLALDPQRADTLYVTTREGAFKSFDGGESFLPLGIVIEDEEGIRPLALEVDPDDSALLWGPANVRGILHSTNGGNTWVWFRDNLPNLPINQVLPMPGSGRVLAATPVGLYSSTNGGAFWGLVPSATPIVMAVSPADGKVWGISGDLVWKSSTGGSWSSTGAPPAGVGFTRTLALHPQQEQEVWVGAFGIRKSVNGGASWQAKESGLTAANIVATARVGALWWVATADGKIWRSPSGYAWESVALPTESLIVDLQGDASGRLWVATNSGLYRSANGGGHWTQVENSSLLALALDPADSNRLWVASFQGLKRSTNGGSSWQTVGAGLGSILVKVLSPRWDSSDELWAGTADAGLWKSTDGGSSFAPVSGGLSAELGVLDLLLDPAGHWVATTSGLYFSVNGGAQWQLKSPQGVEAVAVGDPGILFGGAGGVQITLDSGQSFADLGDLPPGFRVESLRSDPEIAKRHWVSGSGGSWELDDLGRDSASLQDSRFQIDVVWRDFVGNVGVGRPVDLTSDTGAFWFFRDSNLELMLKILDGRILNDAFWLFSGALSNVEYRIFLKDTAADVHDTVFNESGLNRSFADTKAFPETVDDSLAREPIGAVKTGNGGCSPSAQILCLQEDRFEVSVVWRDFQGGQGVGTALPVTSDTGIFWFFRETNLELIIKILDGRPVNGNFWVFYGALSNVEYEITVRDRETGDEKQYFNALGDLGSVADTGAF